MVSKITMFELHFDGARFGPTVGADDETTDSEETADRERTAGSSGSRTRRLLAVAGALVVASLVRRLVARRSRGDDGPEVEAETVEPSENR